MPEVRDTDGILFFFSLKKEMHDMPQIYGKCLDQASLESSVCPFGVVQWDGPWPGLPPPLIQAQMSYPSTSPSEEF